MRRHTSTLIVLVLVAILILGTRGSFGLFVLPWEEQLSVSRTAVSSILALGFLTYGLAQPTAGKLLQFMAPRWVISAGLVLVAAGLYGAAVSTTMVMLGVSIGLVSAFGTGLASLSALSYVAGELVETRGGLVFGLLTAGGAGGQVVILPIATRMLDVSLKASLFVLAGLALAGAVAVVLTVPALPTRDSIGGLTPVSEMVRETRFWLLLVPFFVCGYTTTGMIQTHLIPFALDHHVNQTTASAAMATLAAFNIGGVLVAGAYTDRVDRGKMLALIYLMRAGTLLILPFITSASGLFAFGVLFGIADFSTVPPTTSLTQTVFKSGGWAVAIGLISAAHQAGAALGAWMPARLLERTGSYTTSWVSGAVVLLVAACMSYLLREPTQTSVEVS